MALTDKLSAIGDAIRAKTGKTDLIQLDQMPTEIASIQSGGDATMKTVEGTLPLTVAGVGQRLEDYKIYGAEGGVGNKNKNLFNSYTLIEGYSVNWNDGSLVANSNGSISDYTDIEGASKITVTILTETNGGASHPLYFYDADKNYIQISDKLGLLTDKPGQRSKTFTVPEGAKYCRFYILTNYSKGNTVWAQIEVGNTFTGYIPYGYEVPIKVNDDVYTIPSIYPQLGIDDYIDFENRKVVIGGVSTMMELPEIHLSNGTNVIDVDTAVKPSKMSVSFIDNDGGYAAGYKEAYNAMKLAVDMSDVTYRFNETVASYPGNWYRMSLNFTDANGVAYKQIASFTSSGKINIQYTPVSGSAITAYNGANSPMWVDEAYRTIHITDGAMTGDIKTCAWLIENGQFNNGASV